MNSMSVVEAVVIPVGTAPEACCPVAVDARSCLSVAATRCQHLVGADGATEGGRKLLLRGTFLVGRVGIEPSRIV